MRGAQAALIAMLAGLQFGAESAEPPGQGAHVHTREGRPPPLAPGYARLSFEAPAPGSYALPALGIAGDGAVLDATGRPLRLHELYGSKVVVLSFIYTSCPDVNGCPLASFVLSMVQREVVTDPRLRDAVRLVSLSFDPAHDTPGRMASYGRAFRKDGFDWRFLTFASEREVSPLLERYGQYVGRERGEDGGSLSTMTHLLRIYLIDRDKRIRNIYTPSYLHPDLLLADIRTVLADTAE